MPTFLAITSKIILLIMLALGNLYLYFPITHFSWIKSGIPQSQLPKGKYGKIVFQNVNLIPLQSNQVLNNQTLLVEDSSVKDTDEQAMANAHIIDAQGKYLIPGLHDMHVHLFGVENDLLLHLIHGITHIRVLGQESPDVLAWRDDIQTLKRIGPNMTVFWPMVESNPRGFALGETFASNGGKVYATTTEELEDVVRRAQVVRSDGIKVHGVQSRSVLNRINQLTSQSALKVEAHIPEELTFCKDRMKCWRDFLSLKTQSVAHIEEIIKVVNWDNRLPQKEIDSIAQDVAQQNIWVTTTLEFINALPKQATDLEKALSQVPELKFLDPTVYDMFWQPGHNDYQKINAQSIVPYNLAHKSMLQALHKVGAKLMAGSDTALPLSIPGVSLHQELKTMVDYGLTPFEALQTATKNPSLYLNPEKEFIPFQSTAPANFVLLNANPLENIEHLSRIEGVMIQGHWYSSEEIQTIKSLVEDHNQRKHWVLKLLKAVFLVSLLMLIILWLKQFWKIWQLH